MNEPATTDRIRIGVIIVAYNSDSLLDACISGALLDPQVSDVRVVDNSSSPESERIVNLRATADSRVQYMNPRKNLGFAKGCNSGAADLNSATHYFFVNPDVRLTRPLSPLVAHMEDHHSAIVTARLSSPSHPSSVNIRPIATMGREFLKALVGSRAYMPHHLGASALPVGDLITVGQVDGALLGIRADTFTSMGAFDERFELYYEDVDICSRAESIGGCLYVSQQWGIHVGGASSASASANSYIVGRVSRVRYLRKRYGKRPLITMAIGAIALLEFVSRSLSKQAEGMPTRRSSVVAQFAELKTPGSVRILS